MAKELVVIVDEEAKKNLSKLRFRWFFRAQDVKKSGSYTVETPLGERRGVEGVLLREEKGEHRHNIDEHSSEYLYLELTKTCNFSCEHCGIKKDLKHTSKLVNENAAYITPEFTEALSRVIEVNPYFAQTRSLFYGGGEPLIAPSKFAAVHGAFSGLERTDRVVITNGCALPLDQDEFYAFMDKIGKPYIFFTTSNAHRGQYARLVESGKAPKDKIPDNVEPDKAILEKAGRIFKYCSERGLGFTHLPLDEIGDEGRRWHEDLRKHIIQRALGEAERLHTHYIPRDEKRDPCSHGQELAIRTNGDLYPYCTDIFNGHPRLGVVGLLAGSR